jgi:hypothetical protein
VAHRVVTPGFERRDGRGVFREVLNGFSAQTLVTGTMREGAVMGNHYHRKTRVFFYLGRGEASVRTVHAETGARDEFSLGENQGVFLEPNESHAIRFHTESEFIMLKSLRYDPEDPDTYELPV